MKRSLKADCYIDNWSVLTAARLDVQIDVFHGPSISYAKRCAKTKENHELLAARAGRYRKLGVVQVRAPAGGNLTERIGDVSPEV